MRARLDALDMPEALVVSDHVSAVFQEQTDTRQASTLIRFRIKDRGSILRRYRFSFALGQTDLTNQNCLVSKQLVSDHHPRLSNIGRRDQRTDNAGLVYRRTLGGTDRDFSNVGDIHTLLSNRRQRDLQLTAISTDNRVWHFFATDS